jgi:hypothetical protein
MPELAGAARALEAYGPRRVHVTGSMRLPLWLPSEGNYPTSASGPCRWTSTDWHSARPRESPHTRGVRRPRADLLAATARSPTGPTRRIGPLVMPAVPQPSWSWGHPAIPAISRPGRPVGDGWAEQPVTGAEHRTWIRAQRITYSSPPEPLPLMLGHHWNLRPRLPCTSISRLATSPPSHVS